MSEWIKHDGKGMPVDGDTLVLLRFLDGYCEEAKGDEPNRADFWAQGDDDWWSYPIDNPDSITHYRIIENKED